MCDYEQPKAIDVKGLWQQHKQDAFLCIISQKVTIVNGICNV